MGIERREARLAQDRTDVTKEVSELEMRRRLASGESDALDTKTPADSNETGDPLVRIDENGFMEIREPLSDDDENGRSRMDATANSPVFAPAERATPSRLFP